jgi:outer membrane protein TolC
MSRTRTRTRAGARASAWPWRRALVLAGALGLAGCTTLSPDLGFAPVAQTAQERLGKTLLWARSEAEQASIDERVAALLAKPLTLDDAVQLALFNNRALQASFHELGIGQAELVQATRLPNPGVSFSRLTRGHEVEFERGLHVSLARLLTMRLTGELEARRFAQTQQAVALNVLTLALETRKAWVHAVAAEEGVRYMQQVSQAAQASAELARRMEQVGNFNKLQRAREQGFYADAALALAQAEQAQRASRERLVRALGLWGTQLAFKLPERLPELPAQPLALPDIEALALAQRLDVLGAKAAVAQTAQQLGLTRRTRFINVLELGAARNSSNEAPVQRGWEISVELPLFDWGEARVARAEHVYMQAVHRTASTAIHARSEVREAYTAYRSALDIARHHRDEIVPLRKRIAEENLLRYNGMLIGVFELLADARVQIASVNAAIQAQRDFWLAQADLDMAMIGPASLSSAAKAAPTTPEPAAAAPH